MRILALLSAIACLASSTEAALVNGIWDAVNAADDGGIVNGNTASPSFNPQLGGSGISLASPIFFDGDSDVTNNASIVLGVGESLIYSGSITVVGTVAADAGFRFGVLDRNSNTDYFDWIGYVANSRNTNNTLAGIFEHTDAGATDFGSNNVASGAFLPGNAMTNGVSMGNGTFDFSMTIERTGADTYAISASINGTDNAYSYSVSAIDSDAHAALGGFNYVGITLASNFDADNPASLSNVSVTVIPEPEIPALAGLALIPLVYIRRRQRA